MVKDNIVIRDATKEDCPEIIRLIQVKFKLFKSTAKFLNDTDLFQELADYEKMPDGPKIGAKGDS